MSIPKIIHYCWFGNNPKPASVIKCIESWKKYCPDYKIIEWSEKNINIDDMCNYCKQAYEEKAWGFVPDYIRLWIIYNYGGIYLDTDVQIIKNFDDLLENHIFLGVEKCGGNLLTNMGSGFGAEKNNEFIYKHMQIYKNLNFRLADGTLNRKPSPHYTTECLNSMNIYLKNDLDIIYEKEITVYPPRYFSPKDFETGIINITPDTYSVHHYDASWYDEDEKKSKEKRWKRAKFAKVFIKPLNLILGKENANKMENAIIEGHLFKTLFSKISRKKS